MKKIIYVLVLLLLVINCQKNREAADEELSALNNQPDEISQQLDTVKTEEQPETDIPPEQIIKNGGQQSLEKLPKLKAAEYSSSLSKEELWENYNKARKEVNYYKENWDYDKLINSLNQTATISQKLQRTDIASWQFNNIGYYSIIEFKKRTDYDNCIKDIEAMPYGREKNQYISETKEIFRGQMDLLTFAIENLYDAIELDNLAPDKERQKVINSNINYINSVKNFIKQ